MTDLEASMPETATGNAIAPDPAPEAGLRAVQYRDPMRALGVAVNHLMRQPSFAAMAFGHWSRTLVGQINRGHYFFVMRGEEVVGFLGWALSSEANAEAWLRNGRDISGRDARDGDCIIINAWQANDDQTNRFILDQIRRIGSSRRFVYAKRYYPNGRSRPVKLDVNRFVQNHITAARNA